MVHQTTRPIAIALLLIATAASGVALAAPSAKLTTASTKALMRGDTGRALTLANRAIAANPRDPWAYYSQGVAFSTFGRTDAAVRSFAQARDLFGERHPRGRLLAIYGIARAFDNAGRCSEAHSAYLHYARLAGSEAGGRALVYGKACRSASTTSLSAELTPSATQSEPSPFEVALVAYRVELIDQASSDGARARVATDTLIDRLATAIEAAPGARDLDLQNATEPMRWSDAREALLTASHALSMLADGPYAASTSVGEEVEAFRRDVQRIGAEPTSLDSDADPIASALDRADRVLEAIAQSGVIELK
jgi:tetratricopeptide (TPR) repeat protein